MSLTSKAPIVDHPKFKDHVRYDWATWADGKARKLTKGVHFDVSPKAFTVAAYKHAKRSNLRLQFLTEGDNITIQFSPKEPEAKAKPAKVKAAKPKTKAKPKRAKVKA